MVHSALTTRFAITADRSSRGGARVDSIGHHHVAGTSLEAALARFQPGGGQVSPNYCIQGRNIVLVVPEEYRAWTTGSAQDDARSITYEIVNSTAGPSWSFDPDTIASVIALDADISRRYGITPRHALPGYWEHRNIYEWFRRSYPTACAGPSFNIGGIINAVAAGGGSGTAGGGASPIPIEIQEDTEMRIVNYRTGLNASNGEPMDGAVFAISPGTIRRLTGGEWSKGGGRMAEIYGGLKEVDDNSFSRVLDVNGISWGAMDSAFTSGKFMTTF